MLKYLEKQRIPLLVVIGVALAAFLLGLVTGGSGGLGGALSGTAGNNIASLANCDTSILLSTQPTGIVLADPLNLRDGPGFGSNVIGLLGICTPLSLIGRSSDSEWLEINYPGDVEGWVSADFIQSNVNPDTLSVTGVSNDTTNITSGGGGGTGSRRSVSVVINGNVGTVFAYGMPANTQVSAVLSPSNGAGIGRAVSSGSTDAEGNITLTFTMPATWADGSALKSGTMVLTVSGGGSSMSTWITYYKN